MTVTIVINGKAVKKELPTSWDQVTFRQFMSLEKCGNDKIKVIALLIDIDYETLVKAKILNLDSLIAVLGFLRRPAQPIIPTSICGYSVPKDLAFEEVKQYIDIKACIDEVSESDAVKQLERYPLYCAIYACSHRYGRYEFEYAEKLSDIFFNAPCTEVLGIGNFTLRRFTALSQNINPSSLNRVTPMKKFKLALTNLPAILGRISHLFFWKKKQEHQLKNY